MNETDLSDTATRAAEYLRSLDLDGQSWIIGVAINGLVATGNSEFLGTARELVDGAVATQGNNGQLGYGPSYSIEAFSQGREYKASWELTVKKRMNTNSTRVIGHGVLNFHGRTGEDRTLKRHDGSTSRSYRSSERQAAAFRTTIRRWRVSSRCRYTRCT